MGLKEYHRKRDFEHTDEPEGRIGAQAGSRYLVQKHAASRLHYDFRLELDGVLKSWAIPKGPSLDPRVKSLAVHVEDHPIDYGTFEGVIPQGQYGGGTVMLWDRGTWEPEGDAATMYQQGKLVFRIHGERLRGRWALIRMGGKAGQDGKNWLLKKLEDEDARPREEFDVLTHTGSVATGRSMDEIASGANPSAQAARSTPGSRKAHRSSRPDTRVRKRPNARALDPAGLEGARRTAMPLKVAPELPLLVERLPGDDGWLHELKLDGYRLIGVVRAGEPSLRTRRWNDWTHRFPAIARALRELHLENAILDGEIVALRKDGSTDFQALQNSLQEAGGVPLVYFVFDLLYYRGHDLRQVALIDRKSLLSRILEARPPSRWVRYSGHIAGQGNEVYSRACGHGLEGIVAKRAGSPYLGRRTSDWVKIKCLKRQEFVIGGWTEPGGRRQSLGALLLGYFEGPSQLVYCGRVGTGFTEGSLRDLHRALRAVESKQSPFRNRPSGMAARGVIHWADPVVVAEIAFSAWTADGMLRHASFQGIREDKDPPEITREIPAAGPAPGNHGGAEERSSRRTGRMNAAPRRSDPQPAASDRFAGVRLSHPGRILFPDEKLTKRDLAAYYESIADFILPHIVGRPLSLVRCPDGSGKPCFYQKHLGTSMPPSVRGIAVTEKAGAGVSIVIDDLAGLISLVQMGVLEIHPWGSREDRLDRPDRLIVDLDPAEGVPWAHVVQAALHVRQRLAELRLESFVRTTGGKGLHIVVPISRRTP